jgi:hypothetical protein
MEPKLAGRLAGAVARAHTDEKRPRAQQQAYDAIVAQAVAFVPNRTTAAVAKQEDGEPVLIALDGDAVYVVDCLPVENEMEPATGRCRLIKLDPRRDSVEAEAQYRGSMTFGQSRHTTWRFDLGGRRFTLDTVTDSDGECDEAEELGQLVAASIGWNFQGAPEPAGSPA